MISPRRFLPGIVASLLVGALIAGCGQRDEVAAKKVDVAAEVAKLKGDADATSAALTELAAGGKNSTKAVDDIIPLLKDEDHVVRRLAAFALGQIGPAAKAAVPALKPLMDESDQSTVTTAINAINAIAPGSIDEKAAAVSK